jgi:hypothetical protein
MRPGGTLAASEITVYRGAEAILERVTLVIQPGSRIGVVGQTAEASPRCCGRSLGWSRSTAEA